MHDHPILGAVLFAIGAALASFAYFGSFEGTGTSSHISSIVVGSVIALNGFLLVILGSRKLLRAREPRGITR
jgi:uncharacterized membrane protein YidH (DUF202 family)